VETQPNQPLKIMTNNKDQLAQELKEQQKAGIKPSDLKKLKRSKSADDITNIPTPPPLPIVNDQLQEKQKEIESLRKQLEETNAKLKETEQELDQSLASRVAGVKIFGAEHEKRTKAEQELNETVEEASDELVANDEKQAQLRTKLFTAQQEISKLKARLRRNTAPNSDNPTDPFPNLSHLKYTLYTLLTLL